MTMPTIHEDPIEQLRAERPTVPAMPMTLTIKPARAVRSPRRWRVRRVGLTAAAACTAALIGVAVGGSSEEGTGVGLTNAKAAERAFAALGDLADITHFEAEHRRIDTEIGGDRRVEEWSERIRREGDAARQDRSWSSDYLDRDAKGLSRLCIDGRCYDETATSRYEQPWMLELSSMRGLRGSLSLTGQQLAQPPDASTLIARLERERIAEAFEHGDRVTVQFEVPASRLAPFSSTMTARPDLVTAIASGFGSGASADGHDPVLSIRIDADTGGATSITASGEVEHVHADGNGGTRPIRSELVVSWRWTPVDRPELRRPDPADVLVVGLVGRARKGETGPYGVHGTLDQFTGPQLRARAREVQAYRRASVRGVSRRTPARSYPDLWKRQSAEQRRLRAEVARDWWPVDWKAMARSDRCTPFWPDSNREMDRVVAVADPEVAGWRCMLTDEFSSITVTPGRNEVQLSYRVGRSGNGLMVFTPGK